MERGTTKPLPFILCYNDQTKELNPVAVVECKAPAVAVVDTTVNQAKRYADALGCDFMFATNGTDMVVYKYYESENEYRLLDVMPSYNDMINGKATFSVIQEVPPRIPYKKLTETEIIEQYEYDGFIGKDTEQQLKPCIVNLLEGLLDNRAQNAEAL